MACRWGKIEGFEGLYEVSETGDVMNIKTGHIMKQGYSRKGFAGYPMVALYKCGKLITRKVHRLVAIAFIPNPNNYNEVNHINGDKNNNHVENLEWCTHSQNMKSGYDTGLFDNARRLKSEGQKKRFEDNPYLRKRSSEVSKKIAIEHPEFAIASSERLKRLHAEHPEMFAHSLTVAIGRKHYTNGVENRMCFECPEGFFPGRTMNNIRKLQGVI